MPKGIKIVPLVLVEFLENAFKHGFDTFDDTMSAHRWVKVLLKIENGQLHYEVSNGKLPHRIRKKDSKNQGKYGLESIQRRLSNRYGKRYDLVTNATEHTYSITLKIDLNKQRLSLKEWFLLQTKSYKELLLMH